MNILKSGNVSAYEHDCFLATNVHLCVNENDSNIIYYLQKRCFGFT
jgi:hypothetical protein